MNADKTTQAAFLCRTMVGSVGLFRSWEQARQNQKADPIVKLEYDQWRHHAHRIPAKGLVFTYRDQSTPELVAILEAE